MFSRITLRASTKRRLVGVFTRLALTVTVVLSSFSASAGEKRSFSVTTQSLSPRAQSSFQMGKLARSSPSELIVLPKPGTSGSFALNTLGAATLSDRIDTVESSGKVSGFLTVRSEIVSDQSALYGVITRSPGGMYGTILNQSEESPFFYQIRPVGSPVDGRQTHEIEKVLPSELKSSMRCGLGDEIAPRNFGKAALSRAALSGQWREIELLAVAPSEFLSGRSRESAAAQIVNTVASTNLFFESLELIISIKGIQYFDVPSEDPYSGASAAQNAELMLDVAERERRAVSEVVRDVDVVFGRKSYNGVYGLAYRESSCIFPNKSVVFATQGGITVQNEISLGSTLAHELGHFVGMFHDPNSYPSLVGPGNEKGGSLMYAFFIRASVPFSQLSIDEHLLHAGIGRDGGSCFSPTSPPKSVAPDALVFQGGSSETITLNEGKLFQRSIALTTSLAGTKFTLLETPDGMSFDDTNGVLTYIPSFNLADARTPRRTVNAQIIAEVAGKKAVKTLSFNVRNVNRAPVIRSRYPIRVINSQAGRSVSFRVSTTDLDKGDRATIALRSSLRSFPGSPRIRLGKAYIDFTWKIPSDVSGNFTLKFRATDQLRKKRDTSFKITVTP